jgi:hypothetical protein
MSTPYLLVDPDGWRVGDAIGNTIGFSGPLPGRRTVWAGKTNEVGGLSRRYAPSWSPGASNPVGLNMGQVIPRGAIIASATLAIYTNAAVPVASTDFVIGAMNIEDRAVYVNLSGGVLGRDYQLRWTVTDTQGNIWPRTALLLCSLTS